MTTSALSQAKQFLSSWISFQMQHAPLPGLSVAVHHKGRLLYKDAWGKATLPKIPLTTDTRWNIGSQAKMFTMVAILQLKDAGKLQLDDLLITHLPWLATHPDNRVAKITIYHLLTHTSALAREGDSADFWQGATPFPTVPELQTLALTGRIVAEPGSLIKYSNLGFGLLGQVITAASGQEFADYVKTHIITRATLAHTTVDAPKGAMLTTGYTPEFSHSRTAVDAPRQARAYQSVTGIWATPEDACTFIDALPKLLTKSSLDMATHIQQEVKEGLDVGTKFGLGLEILATSNGQIYGHSGHAAGMQSATYTDKKAGLTVSVAVNCKDGHARLIAVGIFDALHFFLQHAQKPLQPERQHFAIRAMNNFSSVEIIATHDKLIAIDALDWQPFSWADELEIIDSCTLKITTRGSIFTEHETIRYTFTKENRPTAICYAGITLTPVA